MMEPMTSKLPPEQRQMLDADFLADEQDYLRLRDGLLASHRGQWVAVHNGQVIAASDDLIAVMEATDDTGGHPFIARVGHEGEVAFRVRRAGSTIDQSPGIGARRLPPLPLGAGRGEGPVASASDAALTPTLCQGERGPDSVGLDGTGTRGWGLLERPCGP